MTNTMRRGGALLSLLLLFGGLAYASTQTQDDAVNRLQPYLAGKPDIDAVKITNGMFDWSGLLTANGKGTGVLMGDMGVMLRTRGPVAASAAPSNSGEFSGILYLVDFAGDMQVHIAGSGKLTTLKPSPVSGPTAASGTNALPKVVQVTGEDYALSVSGSNMAVLIRGGWAGSLSAVGKGVASFDGFTYRITYGPEISTNGVSVTSDKQEYLFPGTAMIVVTNKGSSSVYYTSGVGSPVTYQKLVNGEWVDVMMPSPLLAPKDNANPAVTSGAAGYAGSATAVASEPILYPYPQPKEAELAPGQSISSSFDFRGYFVYGDTSGNYLGDGTYRALFTYHSQPGSKDFRVAYSAPFSVKQAVTGGTKPPLPVEQGGTGRTSPPNAPQGEALNVPAGVMDPHAAIQMGIFS